MFFFLLFIANFSNVIASRGDIYYSDLKDGGYILQSNVIGEFMCSKKYIKRYEGDLRAIDVIRNYYYAELNLEDTDIAQLSIKAIDINGRTRAVAVFTGIQIVNGTSLVILWNKSNIIKSLRFPESNPTTLGFNQSLNGIRKNIDFTITENFEFSNGKIKSTGFKSKPSNCNWLSPREYSKRNPITRNRPTLSSQKTFKKYSVGDQTSIGNMKGTIWKIGVDSRPSVYAYVKGHIPNYSTRDYCTSSVNAPDGWRVATKQELLEIALFKKSQQKLDFNTYFGPDYAVNMVLCREVKGYNSYNWTGDWYWVKDITSRQSNSKVFLQKKKSPKKFNFKQIVSDLSKRTATIPLNCRSCKRSRKKIKSYFITVDNSGVSCQNHIKVRREKRADKINQKLSGCILNFILKDILEKTGSQLYRNLPVKNEKQARKIIRRHRSDLIMDILLKTKRNKIKEHEDKFILIQYGNRVSLSLISETLYNFLKENYGFNGSQNDIKFALQNSLREYKRKEVYKKAKWWLQPGFWATMLNEL